MSTARFYLDFSKCWRFTGAVSQRCAQFCLCWCLGRLHWFHGIFTCLKLGTWSYHQDFKNVIFRVFWQFCRFPFYSYTAWQSCWSYHSCILLVKTCRSLLCSATPSSITSTPRRQSHTSGVPQGCQGFVLSFLPKHGYSWTSLWLRALQGGAWQGTCQLLLGKLVVTQRCDGERGLGWGCRSRLHLNLCVVLMVVAAGP